MSLKTRLVLLSTVWLIFVLLLFNMFTYFFVVRITTRSEIQLLWKKAATITEKPEIWDPHKWSNANLLDEYLVPGELIRIIGPDNKVKAQAVSADVLLRQPVAFRNDIHSFVANNGKNRMVFVQMPLFSGQEQIGMLEIGHVLDLLDDYLSVLVTALTITTGGAVILSLLGGFFYTRFLFHPITRLADTMKAIQTSGVFRHFDLERLPQSDDIRKLGDTFNRMMDSLEKNFEQQKRFVADASHELRTPLTVIESYASILQRWAASDPALREEAVDAIYKEAIHLKNLVSSLMQTAESEAVQRMKWTKVDLTDMLTDVVRHMRRSFHREIEFRHDDTPIVLEADAGKIKQLAIILLDNAIKYSRRKIRMHLHQHDDVAELSVLDMGIGIPADRIPYLFDRFYRVDQARSRKTGGVGLGLAIAQNIVKSHGGSIHVKSKTGRGTKILVRLPLRRTVV